MKAYSFGRRLHLSWLSIHSWRVEPGKIFVPVWAHRIGLIPVAVLVFIAVALTAPAYANEAAALVTKVNGDISPRYLPYFEIPKNTTIEMTDRSELTFVHYESCQRITVVGPAWVFVGLATVNAPTDRVVESRTLRKHCVMKAQRQKKGKGGAAVLVMRSTGHYVSSQPKIVLTGNIARVENVAIFKNGIFETKFDPTDAILAWPNKGLELGAEYKILLTLEGAGATESYSLIPDSDAEINQIILLSVD
jgi:hypothetical protein